MGAQAPPTPSASRNAKALRSGRGSLLCPHVDKLGPVFQGVGIRRETGVTVPSDLTPSDLEEVYATERHLLYVACTRARDHLLVTAVRPASEFLQDLTED